MSLKKPKNRVKELRSVRAGDLIANEDNWRVHPEGQRTAMREALDSFGVAGAMIAFERPYAGKGRKPKNYKPELVLIDGHLRQEELDPDYMVPVLIVDVSEAEARGILATHDAIGALAEIDEGKLESLLSELEQGAEEGSDALASLAKLSGSIREGLAVWPDAGLPTALGKVTLGGQQAGNRPVIVINFEDNEKRDEFLDLLGVVDGKERNLRRVSSDLFTDWIVNKFGNESEDEGAGE